MSSMDKTSKCVNEGESVRRDFSFSYFFFFSRSFKTILDVAGDLEDLRPVWPDDGAGWADPDDVDPALVAELAIEALAHVLDQAADHPVELAAIETGTVARLARRLRG